MLCPSACDTCLDIADDVNHPCTTCANGYGYISNNNLLSGAGGMCQKCSSLSLSMSGNSRRLRLQSSGNSSSLEGQLRVYYHGTWWAVCDDGWTMTDTEVVCREMGLGRGVAFFLAYGSLKPSLSSFSIGFDDVSCSADDQSFFFCNQSQFGHHNCEDFESIGVQCSGPVVDEQCVATCPLGQYVDSSGLCIDCPLFNCLVCGPTGQQCSMCEQNLWIDIYGNCVASCPFSYHGNTNTGVCEPCSSGCRSCRDGAQSDICVSCVDGLILYDEQCVGHCPVGTLFQVANDGQSVCVQRCLLGFFEVSGKCEACLPQCLSCSQRKDNCTNCASEMLLLISTDPAVLPFSCLTDCPLGYFSDAERVCQRCSDVNCMSCYLGGIYCSSCFNSYFLQMNRCVSKCSSEFFPVSRNCALSCPKGFFGDLYSGLCQPCRPYCSICYSFQFCSVCESGFFLKDGECARDCGQSMIAVGKPTATTIRITGGLNPLDGRVELFIDSEFYPVLAMCSDNVENI